MVKLQIALQIASTAPGEELEHDVISCGLVRRVLAHALLLLCRAYPTLSCDPQNPTRRPGLPTSILGKGMVVKKILQGA